MVSFKISHLKPSQASFSPLLKAGAAYLAQTALKSFFKNPNLNMDSSSHIKDLFSGLFDPNESFGNLMEASDVKVFFGDYLTFMLLMIILNVIILLFSRSSGYFSHKQGHSKTSRCQLPRKEAKRRNSNEIASFEIPSEHAPDQKESLMGKLIKPLIKAILCYTLVFCLFETALFSIFALYGSGKINNNLPLSHQLRALEETPVVTPDNKEPEKVSLAVGRVLASFDVEPTIIAMSQDERWAYVSTDNPQLIRVYDTSDFKSPVQVAALNLGRLSRTRMFLELSPDGTILVASNYDDVKIINVTNPRSPQLVGSFFNPMYLSFDNMVFVSMAISPDNKYLYIAEVAFAILDISNPSKIRLLFATKDLSSMGSSLISLSASRDRKLVYVTTGKGALETYNVTDPRNPKVISTFTFSDSSASSVFLSKDDNLAYVVGISSRKLGVNILDISNPLKAREVSKFTVPALKTSAPIIQALSPRETKLYIIQQRLMVIDLVTMTVESNAENLVKNSLLSICFSSSGQYVGVAYLEQIVFIELFTDYPNTKIFTPSNSSTASFVMDQRFESWATSRDGNVLFLAVNDYERLNTSFEIWNIKNKEVPKRIASLNATSLGVDLSAPLLSFKMSPDSKRAYLKWWTFSSAKLIVLDLTGGDLTAPKKLKEYLLTSLTLNFEDFIFSSNEKILCVGSDEYGIKLYNVEGDLQKKAEIDFKTDLNTDNFDLAFVKNDTILLVITSKISIYNIEDLSNPKFLGSFSMTEGGSPRILSVTVLEEENSLIIEWFQTSRKLRIYNISDILAPRLISELSLPKRTFNSQKDILFEFYGPFVYSESQKLGYVATNGKLLRVDLSDLKNPAISGIVPVPTCEECGISRFIISPDGNTGFATNQTGMLRALVVSNEDLRLYSGSDLSSQIFAIDLQVKSTLYIPQEKFLLGERYSDNIFILKSSSGKQGYQVAPRAQSKILKLYTYDVQVVSSEPAPKVTTFSLPDWIKFNQDTFLLTVEPKSKKDLGVYTICSAISNQVNKFALDNIGPVNNTFKMNKILTVLVSLGYMDRQFYLTTEFGTREDFFLPEEYAPYKGQIYDILSKYYIEACTKIGIEPSLKVSVLGPSNRIWIDTTSTEALKVDITLLPDREDNSKNAQFLNKAYGPLIPEVRDQKLRIVLEGNLNEIHAALQNVIINGGNNTFYDGIVSINDGLNYPIVGRRINNISECFMKNSPPFENPNVSKTFQEQLERVSVATGQYFTIMWDENTFKDKYAEALHYEVVIDNDLNLDKPKAFPDWLTFSNLALRGTPPEKLTDREVSLKFVARNEFQNVTIPFKLKIGISPTFALSLLIKYSPMLLTALGFYIKANRIYNIVAKKRYKHSKEYSVQVGEEISILPVLFIENELKETQVIIKELLKYLNKKNESELMSYFVDERRLDKNKIIESINQAVSDLPVKEKKKLQIYLDGSDFNRKKVTQIIFNRISMLQLGSAQERPTKLAFENIKDQWTDLVEWNPELLFVVNTEKLSNLLDKKSPSLKTQEDSPSLLGEYRQEINQDLLQDVIISHAFSHQSLDARSTMVLIETHERFERNKIQMFLKRDLEGSHLNSKSSVDYGFHCKLEDGMLVFSGTPKENFKGRTLAIQIQNIQWRILKEIWIQEKSAGSGDGRSSTIELSSRTESTLRGKTYEIY